MRTQPTKPGRIFTCCVIGLIVMCAVGATATQQQQQEVKLPKIISKVKSLEVVSARITGGNSPLVVIEIRNNSDKPVIAVAVESGNDKDASGVSSTGFKGEGEPPATVIEPRGTHVIRMPFSYVHSGAPVKIAGVMYADNTEEGEEATLKTLHNQKEHEQKGRKEKKGAVTQR